MNNDPIDGVDLFGLKRVLVFEVVTDTTVPRSDPKEKKKNQYWDPEMEKKNATMKAGLEKVLWKCKECLNDKPEIVLHYDSKKMVGGPPKDPKKGSWNTGDTGDNALIKQNFNTIVSGDKSRIPVFWTLNPIGSSSTSGSPDAAGVGYKGLGIVLSFNSGLFPTLLAHELGHYAGYSGGDLDKVHSSKPENVMSYQLPADTPDSDWCAKVAALLQTQ